MSDKTLRTVLVIAGIILLVVAQRINFLRNEAQQTAAPVATATQAPTKAEPTLPPGCQPATDQLVEAIQDGHRSPDDVILKAATFTDQNGEHWTATRVHVPDLADQTAIYWTGTTTSGPIHSATNVAQAIANWPAHPGADITHPSVEAALGCIK